MNVVHQNIPHLPFLDEPMCCWYNDYACVETSLCDLLVPEFLSGNKMSKLHRQAVCDTHHFIRALRR
jgi:hypothetical protein